MAQQIRHTQRVRGARLGASLLAVALGLGAAVGPSLAQTADESKLKKDYPNPNARPKPSDLSHTGKVPDPIANAVGSICLERKFDPLGSTPIT